MSWSIRRTERYAAVIAAYHRAAVTLTRETAEAVVREGMATAPVDTGALSGSGYVASKAPGALTYDEAAAWVRDHRPDAELLPEVPPPARETEATVAWAVDYAAPAEYYTGPKPNHPYAQPAIDRVRPAWDRNLATFDARAREEMR